MHAVVNDGILAYVTHRLDPTAGADRGAMIDTDERSNPCFRSNANIHAKRTANADFDIIREIIAEPHN